MRPVSIQTQLLLKYGHLLHCKSLSNSVAVFGDICAVNVSNAKMILVTLMRYTGKHSSLAVQKLLRSCEPTALKALSFLNISKYLNAGVEQWNLTDELSSVCSRSFYAITHSKRYRYCKIHSSRPHFDEAVQNVFWWLHQSLEANMTLFDPSNLFAVWRRIQKKDCDITIKWIVKTMLRNSSAALRNKLSLVARTSSPPVFGAASHCIQVGSAFCATEW